MEKMVVDKVSSFISVGSNITRDLSYNKRVHMLCPEVLNVDNNNTLKLARNFTNIGGVYYCNG